MTGIWYALLGAGALTGLILLWEAVRRYVGLGLALLAIPLLAAWEFPNPSPLAIVGGNSIYGYDIMALIYAAVALANLRQIANALRAFRYPAAGIALLLAASMARGLLVYNIGSVVNESRLFFYPLAAAAWLLSVDWSWVQHRRALGRWAAVSCVGLGILAVYHLLRYGLGDAATFVDPSTGVEQTSRVLVSGQALFLLLTFVLGSPLRRTAMARLGSALILLLVALSQQRSVWLALAVAMVCAFPFVAGRLQVYLGVTGTLTLLAIEISGGIGSALSSSALNGTTYDSRVASWNALIDETMTSGWLRILFGEPMGFGYARLEGPGRLVTYSPHNLYLTLYLRVGLIGLGLFLILIIGILLRAVASRKPEYVAAVVVMAVYGWTYFWIWYTLPLLLWWLSRHGPDSISRNRRQTLATAVAQAHTSNRVPERGVESHEC